MYIRMYTSTLINLILISKFVNAGACPAPVHSHSAELTSLESAGSSIPPTPSVTASGNTLLSSSIFSSSSLETTVTTYPPTSLVASSIVATPASTSTVEQNATSTCISSGDENTINTALSQGGEGAVVQLCKGVTISISNTIKFTAEGQELSTEGYPTDNTRATIIFAAGTNATCLISGTSVSGVRILNIQVDGNRDITGYYNGGSANIEVGGVGSGQIISHVASRNPRSWSCLHVIEGATSGNDMCSNATVSNNDIGPCGVLDYDEAGSGLWADGISFACTDSVVENNQITGSTDGGIVIFGAPGTIVKNNTVTSSNTTGGWGAINMVDSLYSGNYSNVQVLDNTIIGNELFRAGIAIGACIWGVGCNAPYYYSGPATITGNTFSGNIAFPIPINGWSGGLTVAGNDVSAVDNPLNIYLNSSKCSAAVAEVINENGLLSYYAPGVLGEANLQSEFVTMANNATYFLCPLPSS